MDEFLKQLGMETFIKPLSDEGFTGDEGLKELSLLPPDDLQDLAKNIGMPSMHRKKLHRILAETQSGLGVVSKEIKDETASQEAEKEAEKKPQAEKAFVSAKKTATQVAEEEQASAKRAAEVQAAAKQTIEAQAADAEKAKKVSRLLDGDATSLVSLLDLREYAAEIVEAGYDLEDLRDETADSQTLEDFFKAINMQLGGRKLKVKKALKRLQEANALQAVEASQTQPSPPPSPPPPETTVLSSTPQTPETTLPTYKTFTLALKAEAKRLKKFKTSDQIAQFLELSPAEVDSFFNHPQGQPDVTAGSKKVGEMKPDDGATGRVLDIYSAPTRIAAGSIGNTKTIVVVGETGAGKSTLLDAMLNYCEDVAFDDNFRYELVDERKLIEAGHGGAKATTQEPTVYWMFCKNTKQFIQVVDTPGFKDTDGVAKDQLIVEQLRKLFKETIEVVDYICIVVPAPTGKLTGDQSYVFGQLMSIFGKDVESRIVFMLTFCDGGQPQALKVLKAAQLPVNNWFKFNNSALTECDDGSMTETFWDIGMTSQKEFFNLIQISVPISLQMTQDVVQHRQMLIIKASQLEDQMKKSMTASDRLKSLLVELAKNEAAINANKNVKMKVLKAKQETTRVGPNNTWCQNCHCICHKDCGFGDGDDKKDCIAMKGQGEEKFCTVCKSKCRWHFHNNWRDIKTDNWTETTYEDSDKLIGQLKDFKGAKSRTDQAIDQFKSQLLDQLRSIGQLVVEMRTTNEDLAKIALKKQPFNDLSFFDQLISEENMSRKPGYIARVESYQQYKDRLQISITAATNGFDLTHFVKLNKKELDKLDLRNMAPSAKNAKTTGGKQPGGGGGIETLFRGLIE